MRNLLILITLLFTSVAFSTEVSISGSQAKAVFDALSTEKLEGFQDGAMGKRYITIGAINCFKSTVMDKEEMGCTFESQEGVDPLKVTLKSGYSGEDYTALSEIRMVLNDVTKAELQTQINRKELKIKSLECKLSGYNHVLDSLEIEVNYSCEIKL